MNAFYDHHKDSIRFGYRCLDRILLNGLIQPFQQRERVVGRFSSARGSWAFSLPIGNSIRSVMMCCAPPPSCFNAG